MKLLSVKTCTPNDQQVWRDEGRGEEVVGKFATRSIQLCYRRFKFFY